MAAAVRSRHRFSDVLRHTPYGKVRQHSGHSGNAAQRVARRSRIQPDALDHRVNLPARFRNRYDKYRPGNYLRARRNDRHCRKHEFQENQAQNHHQAHTPEHPHPAFENIRCAFAAAHGERERGQYRQNRKDNVSLADFKKQLDDLYDQYHAHNDGKQPACVARHMERNFRQLRHLYGFRRFQ